MEKIFVLVREDGSPGFRAVQGARALARYLHRFYNEELSHSMPDNIIFLSIPGGDYGRQFDKWANRFRAEKLRYTATGSYSKHSPDYFRSAIAVEAGAEHLVKDLPLFLNEHRTKPDIL